MAVDPMPVRSVWFVVIVLLLAVAGGALWWSRANDGSSAPRLTEAPPATPTAESEGVTAAELVRVYQGPVQQKDGRKVWLFVDIRSAEQRGAEIAFRYFMSSATESASGEGVVDAEGRIRFDGFRGRVVQQRGDVVLQSVGIDGPPYWRLVGRLGRDS